MARVIEVAIARVRDPLGQNPLGLGEAVLLAVARAEVEEDEADHGIVSRLAGKREAAIQMQATPVVAGHEHRRADDHLYRGDDGIVPEPGRQLDRLSAPVHRREPVAIEHPQMSPDPIGGRQLPRRLHGFQHLDRLPARLLGGSILAASNERPGKLGEILPFFQPVSRPAPELDRLAAGTAGRGEIVDNGAFFRIGLEKHRSLVGPLTVGEPQHTAVLRRRRAMGADGSGCPGCCRPELQDSRAVTCALGEMRQLCEVAAAGPRGLQALERQAVELPKARGIEVRKDRLADQLMAERDAVAHRLEQADGHAVAQPLRDVGEDPFQHGVLQPAADHGRGLEDSPAGRAQSRRPRQHGVAHGPGHAGPEIRKNLADEERIAGSPPMQGHGIERPVGDQDAHGVDRQAPKLDADGRSRHSEVAEKQAQGMLGADLVAAIAEDEKSSRLVDAAAEELDQIEGGVIGPVDVLEKEERGPLGVAQLVEHRKKERYARRLALEQGRGGGPRSGARCRRAGPAARA